MTDAREYGKALFLISEEDSTSDKILAQVKTADQLFSENPDYVKLLDSPAVPKEERTGLIDKAFLGFEECLINLIKIMTERRCVNQFGKAAEEFSSLYDRSRGIVRVEAITAVPMDKGHAAALTAKLTASLKKKVVLSNTVDPSILGGVKLRYAGVQLDGSIKTRLDKFEEALRSTVI